MTIKRVLVCGARGFVGRQIVARLKAAGLEVVEGTSATMDFAKDIEVAQWLPRLAGIGAVVNAVGVLRDTAKGPIECVHTEAPCALFEACARAGVRRVVQVSALGIENGSTPYATSKRAADAWLLQLTAEGRLDGVVLRPSVIFGAGGASSDLFLLLARLPVLLLPAAVLNGKVQPLRVGELAEAVEALLTRAADRKGLIIECVGPRALRLSEFIATLRTQIGKGSARALTLPEWMTRVSLRLGDAVPITPWGSQTHALLAQDNVGDVKPFAELLGSVANIPANIDTPLGLVTRGDDAYVTLAHADETSLVRNGTVLTTTPSVTQHAPCWLALDGPFLFSANSPSRSVSRYAVYGQKIVQDAAVVAQFNGNPTDIAYRDGLAAVIDSNGTVSHVTVFNVDQDGNMTASGMATLNGTATNGVAIVRGDDWR